MLYIYTVCKSDVSWRLTVPFSKIRLNVLGLPLTVPLASPVFPLVNRLLLLLVLLVVPMLLSSGDVVVLFLGLETGLLTVLFSPFTPFSLLRGEADLLLVGLPFILFVLLVVPLTPLSAFSTVPLTPLSVPLNLGLLLVGLPRLIVPLDLGLTVPLDLGLIVPLDLGLTVPLDLGLLLLTVPFNALDLGLRVGLPRLFKVLNLGLLLLTVPFNALDLGLRLLTVPLTILLANAMSAILRAAKISSSVLSLSSESSCCSLSCPFSS